MSKISEQKALEVYPVKELKDNFGTRDINRCMREAYIQGYDQAMREFLEKAEKILTERMYFLDDEAKELVEDFVEQFKKYMKDESEK